jgi:hypothetical protein
MSNKLLRLNDLISSLRKFDGRNGFSVNTAIRKPANGFYQVFVDVKKGDQYVVRYVSSNIDEAQAALKGFAGLMEVSCG